MDKKIITRQELSEQELKLMESLTPEEKQALRERIRWNLYKLRSDTVN